MEHGLEFIIPRLEILDRTIQCLLIILKTFSQRRFGCLKKLFNFLRGQKRGRDKSPEKVLFQKTTPIKLIHFPNNLENRVFSKKCDFDGNLHIESHFFPKT